MCFNWLLNLYITLSTYCCFSNSPHIYAHSKITTKGFQIILLIKGLEEKSFHLQILRSKVLRGDSVITGLPFLDKSLMKKNLLNSSSSFLQLYTFFGVICIIFTQIFGVSLFNLFLHITIIISHFFIVEFISLNFKSILVVM